MDEYKGLVRALAKRYYLPGGDWEDVLQEGLMGLYKAMRDYNPEGKTSFRSFAAMVIDRQLISALKTAHRGKALVLTHAERLEAYIQDDQHPHRRELGSIIAAAEADPLETIIANEESAAFYKRLSEILSSLEIQVLKCHIAGYSNQEIAQTLSRTAKAVDNALTRIKRKSRRKLLNPLSRQPHPRAIQSGQRAEAPAAMIRQRRMT